MKTERRSWLKTQLSLLSIFLLMPFASASSGLAAGGAVTASGSLGLLVSLGIENIPNVTLMQARVYYRWICFATIMIIGFWIDQRSSAEFCIFACLMSALFAFFGWFTVPVLVNGVDTGSVTAAGPWALIILAFVLSVGMYIGDQKRKYFGFAPNADTLINIVVYMMILQACVALINGATIFDATSQITTPNECGGTTFTNCYVNGNTQLTNIQSNSATGGILSGTFDLVTTLLTMGWASLVGVFSVIISIVCFPIVLQTIFPWIAASPPTLALLSIFGIVLWIMEILLVFRWLFKPMPGEGKIQ